MSDDPVHEYIIRKLIMEELDMLVKYILNYEGGDSVDGIDKDI